MGTIVFFEVAPFEREALEAARFEGHRTVLRPEPLTAHTAELAAGAAAVSVFVYSKVDEAVLARLPDLRFVSTRSTGFDHLDVEALRRHGVAASYVPSYGENTVAEHAFALILALSRNLQRAIRQTRAGDFSLAGLEGRDLQGKTLGVIGVGRIGVHAVRLGHGAGMTVLAHDVRENPAVATAERFRYVPLNELLAACDVVTIHAALTPETHHLLDRAAFQRIKPGALLVNTARGAIVDSEALLEALEEGRLGGAGLDVFEGEDLLRDECALLRHPLSAAQLRQLAVCHVLSRRDDVILTPHIAFFTREGVARLIEGSLDNLRAYLAGKPQHLVPGLGS